MTGQARDEEEEEDIADTIDQCESTMSEHQLPWQSECCNAFVFIGGRGGELKVQ